MIKILNYNKNKGFTIVELIVVIAVFLFIIGAAMGIFISVIQNQKKVLAELQLLNQIGYVEEYMSKALRMAKTEKDEGCLIDWHSSSPVNHVGYIYLLTRYDAELGMFKGIKFINQSDGNTCYEFFLDNATPGDTGTPLVLKELKNIFSNDDSSAVALTSDNLDIKSIRFAINGATICTSDCGASDTEGIQPRVSILMRVGIPGDAQNPIRTIQTTVSRRNLNVRQQ